MWKAELVSNEYGYLTQKIFKMLKILLTVKWERGKIKLREDLLNKNEPEHYDLGNSQPIKMAKHTKIKRLLQKV